MACSEDSLGTPPSQGTHFEFASESAVGVGEADIQTDGVAGERMGFQEHSLLAKQAAPRQASDATCGEAILMPD